MKRRLMYAGLISAVISTGGSGVSFAGPSKGTVLLIADSGVQGSESGFSTRAKAPTDKHTELTGGQQGIPNEYSGTPVRQGKLEEVTGSKWLQKPIYGMQETSWGKSSNCSKDQKTGDIEYVVLVPSDSKMPVPLRWRQFQERNDQLRLNMKKKELKTAANVPNAKDMSPDIQEHMNHMEQARSQPKAGQ